MGNICGQFRGKRDTTASSEYVLPPEVWNQVLKNVPPKDLCSVVLTSTQMNTLASSQDLWAGIKLSKKKVMQDGLIEVFTINRFEQIKALDLSNAWATSERKENLLRQIPQTPLEEVIFSGNRMSGVSAEVLAQGVAHLKAVDLSWTELSTRQSIKLLEASIDADSLEKVSLSGVDLRRVPASLLARAVCRLQSVILEDTRLTTEQLTELLQASLSSNTLVEVNLAYVNLTGVPTELLASAVGRLHKVNLFWTWNYPWNMTGAQYIAVGQAVLSSTSLRQADLRSPVSQRNLPAPLLNSLKLLDYVKI